ncbi:unnamed protein product [Cunninghamella blakesleeana]
MYQTMTEQEMVMANQLSLTNNHSYHHDHYSSTSSISSPTSTHSSPSSSSIHYFNQHQHPQHSYTFHQSLTHLPSMNNHSSPILNDDLTTPMINDFQTYCSSNCPSPSPSLSTSITSPTEMLPPMRPHPYQQYCYSPHPQNEFTHSMMDYHHPQPLYQQDTSPSITSSPSLRHDSISSTSSTISSFSTHIYHSIYSPSSSSSSLSSPPPSSMNHQHQHIHPSLHFHQDASKKLTFKDDTIEALTGMPSDFQQYVQTYQQQLKLLSSSIHHASTKKINSKNHQNNNNNNNQNKNNNNNKIIINDQTIELDMNRPYKCMKCVKAFARKHDLQRHTRVHTGAKPYFCLCCKKDFARTDALKRHLRMEAACRNSPAIQHLKNTGKRRYRNL